MPSRYNFPTRVQFNGDTVVAQQHLGRAKVLLGVYVSRLVESGLSSGKVSITENGIQYDIGFFANVGSVEITVPQTGGTQDTDVLRIWIPQGFVVTPANTTAVKGWGLPSTLGSDATNRYDPGPGPVNWTVDGALPQVLLSKVPQAGYPRESEVATPLYFDTWETRKTIKVPAPDGAWAAYRISFHTPQAGLTQPYLDEINSRRPSDSPLSPTIRGHFILAEWFGRLIGRYGMTEANYPIGSNKFYKRIQKDGTAYEVASQSPVGTVGVVDTSSASTVAQVVDALVAAVPDLVTDTTLKNDTTVSLSGGGALTAIGVVDYRDQWLKCGNIDWKSSHPEVPTLSWVGPRGRSVPSYEMSGGVFFTNQTGVTRVYSPYFIDTATRKFGTLEEREFDRFVYARGRILAQAPNSGYVLGAAIQRIDEGDGASVYRLYVITWHRADQKYIELQTGGLLLAQLSPGWYDTTSDVRVWYADLPQRNGLACLPDQIVDGLYDATTNPVGWQAAGRFRLDTHASQDHWPGNFVPDAASTGGNFIPKYTAAAQGYTNQTINAPKVYWQPWMFDGNGENAVCLRGSAIGIYGDFSVLAGPYFPSQMLRLHLTPTAGVPSPTISSEWELVGGGTGATGQGCPGETGCFRPNGALFVPSFTQDLYIGADYVDTTLRIVKLTGSFPSFVMSGPNGVIHDLSDFRGTLLGGVVTVPFLDARTDDAIVVEHSFADGTTENVRVVVIANRVQVDSANASGDPAGVAGWGDENGWQLTLSDTGTLTQEWFGIQTTVTPGATVTFSTRFSLPAFARQGADYIASYVYGTIGVGASFTLNREVTGTTSSFEADTLYDVDDGWLNFAGVV